MQKVCACVVAVCSTTNRVVASLVVLAVIGRIMPHACVAQTVADSDTLLLVAFEHGCQADYAVGSTRAQESLPLSAGRFGRGVELSGGQTLTYVGNDGNFHPAAGTIEFWMRPHWTGRSEERHSVFSCTFGKQGYININTLGKGRIGIAISAGAGPTWKWRRADADISGWQLDQWHHVACTWGEGKIQVIVDDSVGETVDDARMPDALPETLRFNGAAATLDDIQISQRAVSAAEVRQRIRRATGPVPFRALVDIGPGNRDTVTDSWRVRLGDIRIPLMLATKKYAKSVATRVDRPRAFPLNGEFDTLQTRVGVDRFSAASSRCRFTLLGDGKKLFESPMLGVTDAPVECRVSVAGVRQVELWCRDAGGCDASTIGVWAEAVVARRGAQPVVMRPRAASEERIAMYQRQMDADRFAGKLPSDVTYCIVPKFMDDDIDPRQAPTTVPPAPQLEALAAPGSYESVNCVVYARRDLHDVKLTATALVAGAQRIAADHIDVRLVLRGLMRDIYPRPVEQSTVVSRFLLANRPLDIPAGTFREYQLIVHVPSAARSGVYRGSVRISVAGLPRRTIPLSVEVSDVRLQTLTDRAYGVYYRFPRDDDWTGVRQELADIRAHGGTMLFPGMGVKYARDTDGLKPSLTSLRRALNAMRAGGFHGPIPVGTGLQTLVKAVPFDPVNGDPTSAAGRQFQRLAEQSLQALVEARRDYPQFDFLATHMDEVLGRGRLPLYIALSQPVRKLTPLRLYITLHNRPVPGIEEMTRQIDPFVDVRSYNGHSIDDWLRAGHSFDEFAAQLQQAGDEAWVYYNIRGAFFRAEWMRLVNGFYLWVSPLRVHVPWMYYSVGGNPLDDSDSDHHDFVYAIPDPANPREMISTRHWEAFREGVDDMRYLRTVENLIAQHAGAPQADAARKWLAALRQRLSFTTKDLQDIKQESPVLVLWSQRFNGADYCRFRREVTRHIQALQQLR